MNKKEIIKMMIFPLVAGLVIFLISHFLFIPINNNLSNYAMFYKEENVSLDVVLIGNSTVRSGFVPAYAWQNYGFTSFSIAAAPTHPEVIKIALREVAFLQKPKVVYVDINGLTYQKKADAAGFVEKYIDSMPDGERKADLSKEFKHDAKNHHDDKFFKHHNQFRNPDYFKPATWKYADKHVSSIMKGYQAVGHSKVIEPVLTPDDTVLPLFDDGREYLSEILEICKQYADINFIFGKMPRFLTESNIGATYQLRSAKPIIESYGFKFMDFYDNLDEIGLDNRADQYDEEHLNHNGAIKFTRFFSEYLINEYGVCGPHPKSVEKNYDLAYEKYCKAIKKAEINLQKPQDKQKPLYINEADAFLQTYNFNARNLIIPAAIVAGVGIIFTTTLLIRKRKSKNTSTKT